MKRITVITLLAIANFAMAGTSFAQSNGVRATVPFDFTVGNKLLPAGTYSFKKQSDRMISITNHDKPIAAIGLVNEDDGKFPDRGRLLFHKYGSQYFLSEILCQSANMNLELLLSKTEKRAALQQARLSAHEETFVAAR
jgi:hypothetical protein